MCFDRYSYENNEILFCDKCNIPVHQLCYGVEKIPEGEWYCSPCSKKAKNVECCLCPCAGGGFKSTTDGRWVHLVCALWVPNVRIVDPYELEPIDVTNVEPDRYKLKCNICRIKKGAPCQCNKPHCATAFHPICAFASKYVMKNLELPSGELYYISYCQKHASTPDSESLARIQATLSKTQRKSSDSSKRDKAKDKSTPEPDGKRRGRPKKANHSQQEDINSDGSTSDESANTSDSDVEIESGESDSGDSIDNGSASSKSHPSPQSGKLRSSTRTRRGKNKNQKIREDVDHELVEYDGTSGFWRQIERYYIPLSDMELAQLQLFDYTWYQRDPSFYLPPTIHLEEQDSNSTTKIPEYSLDMALVPSSLSSRAIRLRVGLEESGSSADRQEDTKAALDESVPISLESPTAESMDFEGYFQNLSMSNDSATKLSSATNKEEKKDKQSIRNRAWVLLNLKDETSALCEFEVTQSQQVSDYWCYHRGGAAILWW